MITQNLFVGKIRKLKERLMNKNERRNILVVREIIRLAMKENSRISLTQNNWCDCMRILNELLRDKEV